MLVTQSNRKRKNRGELSQITEREFSLIQDSKSNPTEREQVSAEKIVYTKGVDTYVHMGNNLNTISLNRESRTNFFKQRPAIKELLLREEQNPLIEEGEYVGERRDREGEYYLTHEALTLLIEKEIRQKKNRLARGHYNTRNIFVIKNNVDQLKKILALTTLKNGEDAKIVYIDEIHAITIYICNDNNIIKTLILDPEPSLSEVPNCITPIIKQAYPGGIIFVSSTHLQKDYYSCTTFAYKHIKYFVKHGPLIFPYLDQLENPDKSGYYVISPDKLMPALLKMCQSDLELPQNVLETPVSIKKELTLEAYWKKNQFTKGEKKYNSAALLKRYGYLEHLAGFFKDKIEIDRNINCSLPMPFGGIHQHYSEMSSHVPSHKLNFQLLYRLIFTPQSSQLINKNLIRLIKNKISPERMTLFRSVLRAYQRDALEIALFENNTDPVPRYTIIDMSTIEKTLFELNHKYPLAEVHSRIEQFAAFYRFCKVISECFEQNAGMEHSHWSLLAYKLLILFSSENEPPQMYLNHFDNYLKKHSLLGLSAVMHDALQYSLPTETIDLEAWKTLIFNVGPRIFQHIKIAPDIEAVLGNGPSDYQEFLDVWLIMRYRRQHENRELAQLCIEYNINEQLFNRCLDLSKHVKSTDNLPFALIDGRTVNKPGYFFLKLPCDDPRALLLGYLTNCCQSIGGDSQQCVIDGITLPNNGFYVLLKENEKGLHKAYPPFLDQRIDYERYHIVGQGYAWLSRQGNLTFDSWENKRTQDNEVIVPFLMCFAKEVTHQKDSTICRVTIGIAGGRTPKTFARVKIKHPELLIEGLPYVDSSQQGLIYENTKKTIKQVKQVHRQLKLVMSNSSEGLAEKTSSWFDNLCSLSLVKELVILLKSDEFRLLLSEVESVAKLSDLLNSYGPLFWELLVLLFQANILTKERLKETLTTCHAHILCDSFVSFSTAIRELKQYQLLNENYYDFALGHYLKPRSYVLYRIIVKKLNISGNYTLLSDIKNDRYQTAEMGFSLLLNSQLMNHPHLAEPVLAIALANPLLMDNILETLIALHKWNYLEKNLEFVMTCFGNHKQITQFWRVFKILQTHNLPPKLVDPIITLVLKNPRLGEKMMDALKHAYESGLLDDRCWGEYVISSLLNSPQISWELGRSFIALYKTGLFAQYQAVVKEITLKGYDVSSVLNLLSQYKELIDYSNVIIKSVLRQPDNSCWLATELHVFAEHNLIDRKEGLLILDSILENEKPGLSVAHAWKSFKNSRLYLHPHYDLLISSYFLENPDKAEALIKTFIVLYETNLLERYAEMVLGSYDHQMIQEFGRGLLLLKEKKLLETDCGQSILACMLQYPYNGYSITECLAELYEANLLEKYQEQCVHAITAVNFSTVGSALILCNQKRLFTDNTRTDYLMKLILKNPEKAECIIKQIERLDKIPLLDEHFEALLLMSPEKFYHMDTFVTCVLILNEDGLLNDKEKHQFIIGLLLKNLKKSLDMALFILDLVRDNAFDQYFEEHKYRSQIEEDQNNRRGCAI